MHPIILKPFVIFVALSCLSASARSDPDPAAVELTSQAQSLLQDSGWGGYYAEAMELLDQAVKADPSYALARQTRLNQYLVKGDVQAAVEESGELTKINDIPETHLFHCMLLEFQNPDYKGRNDCYARVADEFAARPEPHTDLNYVFALRLAEAPEFEAEAKQHLRSLEHAELQALARELLFEKSRSQLIRTYFPLP